MADDVASTRASLGFPAWSGALPATSCIEAEAGDCHENMAIADVDGDPISFAFFSVVEVFIRSQRASEKARLAQYVGSGAGAIITLVLLARMAAAPFVRFALEAISSSDCSLYSGGCAFWSVSDAVFQHCSLPILEPIGNRMFGFYLAGA